ncbi:uncharacterized protein YALI1_D24809g [Yarrowia lipolytica]|uniref:Secreted protein n=1 Tax=Yarrowia lipolytica TaxID=4952 RepID=A0A1D8NFD4_YARLL|nr:hypothetical protein YALI1_D24809g [Yarrowia lipolytica]
MFFAVVSTSSVLAFSVVDGCNRLVCQPCLYSSQSEVDHIKLGVDLFDGDAHCNGGGWWSFLLSFSRYKTTVVTFASRER